VTPLPVKKKSPWVPPTRCFLSSQFRRAAAFSRLSGMCSCSARLHYFKMKQGFDLMIQTFEFNVNKYFVVANSIVSAFLMLSLPLSIVIFDAAVSSSVLVFNTEVSIMSSNIIAGHKERQKLIKNNYINYFN
jgi:hypothetical protein